MTDDLNRQDAKDARWKLPDGWRWVRLGDHVTKVGSGITPLGGEAVYVRSGTPLIRSQNVHPNRFVLDGLVYITAAQDAEMEGSRVCPGDVLLNITGASIGRVCVVPSDICPANVNQHVSIVRCTPDLYPPFLSYYISTPGFQRFIMDTQAGATRQALTKTLIEDFQIPLPPLSEQQRIGAILNEQMAVVERARAAAEARVGAAEALTLAVLRDAFHGVTPLSTDAKRDDPPTGWKWRKLTSIARLESGHTPSRYHPEWWGGTVPWIALPDIRNLDGKVAYETAEYTNDEGIAHSSARVLPAGTVVLSRTASVGFVTVMGREMATSQDFVNWVCGPEIDPAFLAYLLRAARGYIRSLSSGAIHQTVYVPTVKAFEVCLTSIQEQRRIAATLNEREIAVAELRRAAKDELAAINTLPAALLLRAFSGAL